MNRENNYLRYFSENKFLSWIQLIVKMYSKGLSLLVKVRKSNRMVVSTFSIKIVQFLFRMQICQGIKAYIVHWALKKDTLGMDKLKDLFVQ